MIEGNLSCYLEGLINMASILPRNISHSYIRVLALKKKDYKKNFSKYYKIPENSITLEKTNIKEENIFKECIHSKKIVKELIYLIEREIKEPKKIYKAKDNSKLLELLSGYNKGISGFYFVEEVYFVEYKKHIVAYIIGNNE